MARKSSVQASWLVQVTWLGSASSCSLWSWIQSVCSIISFLDNQVSGVWKVNTDFFDKSNTDNYYITKIGKVSWTLMPASPTTTSVRFAVGLRGLNSYCLRMTPSLVTENFCLGESALVIYHTFIRVSRAIKCLKNWEARLCHGPHWGSLQLSLTALPQTS